MTVSSSSAPAKACPSTSTPPGCRRYPQAGLATTSSTPTASKKTSTSTPPTPSPSNPCHITAQSHTRIPPTSPTRKTRLTSNTNSTSTPAHAATKCPPPSATPTLPNNQTAFGCRTLSC